MFITSTTKKEEVNASTCPIMFARHAVETSRGTLVVTHTSRSSDNTQSNHTGVTELSADGHVLRVNKGPISFSLPYYITTVNGHFLVGDRYNRQILHSNADLELTQMLVADDYGNPFRQCYSFETGKFYVNYANSGTMTIYDVR
jgi:hypothetical protein